MKFPNGVFLNDDSFAAMANLDDHSVDMILCDLPYAQTGCSWDALLPMEPLWEAYWRVLKPKGAVVLTASQPFTSQLVMSQIKRFRHEWIWQKNMGSNFATARFSPFKEHESVLVFGEGRSTYNAQMEDRSPAGAAMAKSMKYTSRTGGDYIGGKLSKDKGYRTEKRLPGSVQSFKCERGLHPTQKPVTLFRYLIETYSNEGETVLDNCSGSGTTAIAAAQCGRRFICVERDLGYYEKSVERYRSIFEEPIV